MWRNFLSPTWSETGKGSKTDRRTSLFKRIRLTLFRAAAAAAVEAGFWPIWLLVVVVVGGGALA